MAGLTRLNQAGAYKFKDERRRVVLGREGRDAGGLILIVAYTVRRSGEAEEIRIISARRASRKERAAYGQAKD